MEHCPVDARDQDIDDEDSFKEEVVNCQCLETVLPVGAPMQEEGKSNLEKAQAESPIGHHLDQPVRVPGHHDEASVNG